MYLQPGMPLDSKQLKRIAMRGLKKFTLNITMGGNIVPSAFAHNKTVICVLLPDDGP